MSYRYLLNRFGLDAFQNTIKTYGVQKVIENEQGRNALRQFPYPQRTQEQQAEHNPYPPIDPAASPVPEAMKSTILGTPVIAPLEFKGGSYQINREGDQVEFQGLTLETVIVQADVEKFIERSGIGGKILEYSVTGNYSVSVKGILVSPKPRIYPEQQVAVLHNLIKVPAPIAVVSPYLALHKIYYLVIERASFPASPGFQNEQPFELHCISDEPLQSVITKEYKDTLQMQAINNQNTA